MSLLHLLVEGLTQAPNMSSNFISSFGLLFGIMAGPLPLVNDKTIALYLAVQLLWCVLLWVRAVRTVGSQSIRRGLEAEAYGAALAWLDVFRIAAFGWVLKHVLHFEIGVQMCELYCGVIALRTLLKPLAYVVLRVYGGPAVATRFTGFDPAGFVASVSGGGGGAANAASGPTWKQHGQTSRKATSAVARTSSLAPAVAGSEVKNNNDRCTVVDEGPHFNRTARGCLLPMNE